MEVRASSSKETRAGSVMVVGEARRREQAETRKQEQAVARRREQAVS